MRADPRLPKAWRAHCLIPLYSLGAALQSLDQHSVIRRAVFRLEARAHLEYMNQRRTLKISGCPLNLKNGCFDLT